MMLKLVKRASGHFVTLIEIYVHLILLAFLDIDCFPIPIMQYVYIKTVQVINLHFGLYHCSLKWKSIVLMQITPQNAKIANIWN